MPEPTTPAAPAAPRDAATTTAAAPPHGLSAAVRAALRDVARVVVPVECPGCGALDVPLCDPCARLLGRPRRCEDGAPRLDRLDGRPPVPVWAIAPYAGAVRGLVVAWKDRGRADLGRPLGDAVARAAGELAAPLALALSGPSGRGPAPRLVVVPAPSTWASRLERGRVPVRELAVRTAAALRASGLDAEVVDALAERRGRDQVGLGARARAANVRDRVRARRAAAGCAGRPVLLVDDVLTTGATLATCESVLAAAGAVVVGALVLAATPRPAGRRPGPHVTDPTAVHPGGGGGAPRRAAHAGIVWGRAQGPGRPGDADEARGPRLRTQSPSVGR